MAAAVAPMSFIDLSSLSQSELQTLSLLSSSSSTTSPSPLVSPPPPPPIDHSIFNESTGSRRQTYSSSVSHHRRRTKNPSDNPSPTSPPPPSATDLVHNRLIIDRLKSLISGNPNFHSVQLLQPSLPPPPPPPRKRGRKPKSAASAMVPEAAGMTLSPAAVEALGLVEDPFGEELRRRTEGIETEEGLLGFMLGVDGQWGSRRKRRRIVDSSEFGHVLPFGWKLLLGIRRKEGRAWIYCRRYISPTGEHFISCKEVSLYLQSIGSQNMIQHPDFGHTVEEIQPDGHNTKPNAVLIFKDGDSPSNGHHGNEMVLLGIENLAEVTIRDLFECHKCNVTFDKKNSYLQHLLSVHQRITRRFKVGSSVSEAVIIRDGKYDSHVGNNESKAEGLPKGDGSLSSSRISKIDALVDIAQSSILETSVAVSDDTVIDQNIFDRQDIEDMVVDDENAEKDAKQSEFVEFTNDNLVKMDIDESIKSLFETESYQQPLSRFPSKCEISDKVEQIFGVEPSHEYKMGFVEPSSYIFGDYEGSSNVLLDVPINLANSSEIESLFDGSSLQFKSEEVTLNVACIDRTAVVCVSCGVEFIGAVDLEPPQQSDGLLCPKCK